MNYMNVLSLIKQKTDRLMQLVQPCSHMFESGITYDGKYSTKRISLYEPSNWTHSFFTGIVSYMYYHTKDEKYLDYLLKQYEIYHTLLYDNDNEISHDVGFLYTLYAVAVYKLTGKAEYKKLALRAADELGKRYQFRANVVQSFFDMRKRGVTDEFAMIIVDDMMNMSLLMWAYNETGHSFYRSVYENHIENSVRNLIREDYSIRHAYNFDAVSGKPLAEMNYCGYAIGSHWARGTSWMIYGLTNAMLNTGNVGRFLPSYIGVSEKYMNELGEKTVPAWDFRLNAGQPERLDASAASITASAFMEVGRLGVSDDFKKRCMDLTNRTLKELCSTYLADEKCENIIKQEQPGDLNSGVLWGDYFFVELLMKKIYGDALPRFWI